MNVPLVVGALLFTGTVVGCGSAEKPAKLIDENRGSFEGVVVGRAIPRDLAALVGEPCKADYDLAPCGFVATDITAVQSFPGDWGVDKRDAVTLLTERGEVAALIIADDLAETSKGVGIGDDLADAEQEYPDAVCDIEQFEDSTGNPYCTDSTLPGGNQVQFGGDPIDSIAIGRPGFH